MIHTKSGLDRSLPHEGKALILRKEGRRVRKYLKKGNACRTGFGIILSLIGSEGYLKIKGLIIFESH